MRTRQVTTMPSRSRLRSARLAAETGGGPAGGRGPAPAGRGPPPGPPGAPGSPGRPAGSGFGSSLLGAGSLYFFGALGASLGPSPPRAPSSLFAHSASGDFEEPR